MQNMLVTVFAAACALFMTAACLPETETLLSDPSSAKADQRLLGDWFAKNKGKHLEVTFRRRDDGTMDLFWNEFAPNSVLPKTSVHYRAWTTEIGGRSYLNLTLVAPRDRENIPRRTLVSFDIGKGGTLVFYVLDDRKLEKLIKAGTLAGRLATATVPYGGVSASIDRPVIAMPRDKLVAFLRDRGRGTLFTKNDSILQRSANAPPKN